MTLWISTMANQFSTFNRNSILARLKAEHFDVLVIGGGITGAGIALDAASRGLKVAVVERNDFAFGTSGKSTKLIHGGLRYLKHLEFGLVKEIGTERAIVHNLAPHLVVPEKMLLPLFDGRKLQNWFTSLGLKIYDWLAGVKQEDEMKMLTPPQTYKQEPLLARDKIKGGALYAEYRTDDARLTLELLKTAHQQGAVVINYLSVQNFVYDHDIVSGVNVTDEVSREGMIIKATAIVNAAGPWVDDVRSLNKSKTGKRLHLTKGAHVVVPHSRFPVNQAVYFEVEDGRMIFAIPRGRTTYIGTTDTDFIGDKDQLFVSKVDAEYLLNGVNKSFPKANLSLQDIESSWAGLRPLIYEEGKTATELSRKDEIFLSPSGLISIAGGKLTGYRKMAERVVDLIENKYFSSRQLKSCHTHEIKLSGNSFTSYKDVKNYRVAVRRRLNPYGVHELTAHYLVENYGIQTDRIIKHFEEQHREGVDPDQTLIMSELWFTVHYEMIVHLNDFFVRRTGLLYFDIEKVNRWKGVVAEELKKYLSWSDTRKQNELDLLEKAIVETRRFE